MKRPRSHRRRGIGFLGVLLMGLGLVFVISVLRRPRNNYQMRGGGFPYAPETSEPAEAGVTADLPRSPESGDLAELHTAVMRAQEDIEAAITAGEPGAIATAREALSAAQADLTAGLSG